jgi:hypothetical protein
MEKPKKNQHYVPQSYLENFSLDPNKNEKQIFVFDKDTQRKFPNNIKNIPLERYFYDFPENLVLPGEDPQKVENFFDELEGRQKKLLKHIKKKIDWIFSLRKKGNVYSKKVLNQSQKIDLSYVVAFQLFRTREFRNFLLEMREVNKPFFDKLIKQEINELFTSDHPIVQYPHLGLNGINSPGIEIAFPINSKAILIMKEKSHFYKFAKLDGNLFPLTLNDVNFYNQLQVYGSNRFVFCSEDRFDLVEEICKNNPDVCSSNKTRIQLKEIPTDDL